MAHLPHLVIVQDGFFGSTGSMERLSGLLKKALGNDVIVMRSCSSHPWGAYPSVAGTLDGIPAAGCRLADEIERSVHGALRSVASGDWR